MYEQVFDKWCETGGGGIWIIFNSEKYAVDYHNV